MADLRERVGAEIENLDGVLARMPPPGKLRELSDLELAGVGALLHSFYNGVENVLKQILLARGIDLPKEPSWHRELVDLALRHLVLSEATHSGLRPYVAFRHFFSHGYSFQMDPERLAPLVAGLSRVYEMLQVDTERSLGNAP